MTKKRKIIDINPITLDVLQKSAGIDGRSTKNLIEYILDEYAAVARGDKKRMEFIKINVNGSQAR